MSKNTCKISIADNCDSRSALLLNINLVGPQYAHAVSVKLQATSHSWPATSESRALLLGRATLLCSTYWPCTCSTAPLSSNWQCSAA